MAYLTDEQYVAIYEAGHHAYADEAIKTWDKKVMLSEENFQERIKKLKIAGGKAAFAEALRIIQTESL